LVTRSSRLLLAFGIVVPALPILVGLVLPAGGSAARVTTPATYIPVPKFTLVAVPPALSPVPPSPGVEIARLHKPTTMRATPGGRSLGRVGLRTNFNSPTVLWVARQSGKWLGVVSVLAGNNHLGWIPASDATLSQVDFKIEVSLHQRRVTVLDSGRVLKRYTVAVGRPTAPTPTGRFAVTDRLATGDPSGPYGCCIIALSAESPHAIADWSGGNRIAIHSTPETSSIGHPVSHGCMRLTLADGRWLMTHVPLGTPTIIRE
jgi:lipoprotein-anchoring transpeptidase ErfK/SrfK